MAAGSVIFLTGAPPASTLSWNEHELPSHFNFRHRRFLQADEQGETTQDSLALATQSLAKWRELEIHGQHHASDNAKEREVEPEATQFLSLHHDDSNNDNAEHTDFLERSLYALQNLASSQIAVPEDTVYDETTFVTGASSNTTLSTELSYQTSTSSASDNIEQQVVNFNGPITDLKRIPNARYLESIHPQTMTINVLVGVIAVQPTRTVQLRKRTGEMDIVEVVVGDDTKAGFNISFWLPPMDSQTHRSRVTNYQLRDVLQGLRSGDIILVTHIALGEFKNNVFGQSLSKRITRNNTSIVLLSSNVTGLPPPLVAKLNRVRDWSSHFVGKKDLKRASSPDITLGVVSKKAKRMLPPDTQPGEL
ncbi:uncharacterized protein MYCFIDRAFT_214622 [Pseudocercospora fijiensis CIRAD86]|uniref:OB domain-containing protein n=1 Tax=Pseudocercospora fijiensis (strain CIRAD86) TaxID=383855 RepID=M2Z2P0_PSEFD|nr:uncharacterized protein MYCFIDRAFT_214622 [Pseudocercospora fijiensis CIRAD86]EME84120.1 hypothetical protein MYCFIDRAFT_214622 [Pseudocercospora fijiensis CIRAD86]